MTERQTRMIVNADDFGYFDEVSRGILDAAAKGVVTATGVMANGPALERWVDALKASSMSIGVHLNATLGRPLTQIMREHLMSSHGEFCPKSAFGMAVLRGQVPVAVVVEEWRAQIRRCLDLGLRLTFLNSHEHVHMMPSLLAQVRALAQEFGIANVRAPQPEWGPRWDLAALLRNAVFVAAKLFSSRSREPVLIGVTPSGKLSNDYCAWRLSRLQRGVIYELMCHPGWNDAVALRDPRLAVYHDWEGEMQALTGPTFADLLKRHGIQLVSYSDLEPAAGVTP